MPSMLYRHRQLSMTLHYRLFPFTTGVEYELNGKKCFIFPENQYCSIIFMFSKNVYSIHSVSLNLHEVFCYLRL